MVAQPADAASARVFKRGSQLFSRVCVVFVTKMCLQMWAYFGGFGDPTFGKAAQGPCGVTPHQRRVVIQRLHERGDI